MTIDWPRLALALLFLFVPIGLFNGPKVRHRPIMRDWTDHWSSILTLGLHWIDLGRAMLGGWWLADAIPVSPDAVGFLRHGVPLLRGGIVLAAITVQTVVCREKLSFYAPYMFVSGVFIGFFPPAVAALAVLLALTLAAGLRAPPVYFPILGGGLIVIGYLFNGKPSLIATSLGCCAALVPWLLPVMFQRTSVLSYRARRLVKPPLTPLPPQT